MKRRRSSESGTQIIEFGLVILPLMALMFLSVDCAWAVFAKASVQYAVRQGCRFAVTSQVLPGLKHDDSIKTVVVNHSFGFLTSTNSAQYIMIEYFDPNTLKATNSNSGGNIVRVEVNDVPVLPMMALLRSSAPVKISAVSSDVMESSPGGIAPSR